MMAGSLLDGLGPELYRENAFRVTGLAVDATVRDVRRRSERLRVMIGMGKVSAAVPFGEPPGGDAAQRAVQRLRDPVRRLVDELFWPWPTTAGEPDEPDEPEESDEAMAALLRGDLDAAAESWRRAASGGRPGSSIAIHNLAVLTHARALDRDGLDPTGRNLWKQAYGYWQEVISDDRFWRLLESRTQELADPRLSPATARRLRADLPAALLSINAKLAVRACHDDRTHDAMAHLGLMNRSEFGDKTVDEVLRRAVEPDMARIRALGKDAQQIVEADPREGDEAARRLLRQARPLLRVLTTALSDDHPLARGIRDEFATHVLICSVRYGNETEDWPTVRKLLKRALGIAVTEPARHRIEENLETVRTNALHATCWFCQEEPADDRSGYPQKLYGEVAYDYGRVAWKTLTITVPRCAACRTAHRRHIWKAGGLGCGVTLLLLGTCVLLIGTGHIAFGVAALMIGCILGGVSLGTLVEKMPDREVAKVRGFGPIQHRLNAGWQIGAKPPEAN